MSTKLNPADTLITEALQSALGQVSAVYGWDVGKPQSFYPNTPVISNTLFSIDAYHGYWTKSQGPVELSITGATVPPNTPIALQQGWNLVGYPSRQSQSVADALRNIDDCYDIVYAYDAFDSTNSWKKFDPNAPSYANNLTTLEPGRGYWIKANTACSWVVNGGGG